MLRVLSISTLFPGATRPGFGKFVANQMAAVAQTGKVDLTVINPLGMPPWPLSRREPYRTLATTPLVDQRDGVRVHHPRFRVIPKIGGDGNPGRLVRAILPLVRQMHAAQPFDLVDAQFFFPDGPAAARVASDLGLPLTIKARGSDIHYWGTRPAALGQMLAAASRAGGMLAVSAALRHDMAALGMPAERIHVHYTGLDRERFHPMERTAARALVAAIPSLAIPGDGPLLVSPGALIPIKGQRLAIAALSRLPDARLALAGTGADEAALRRQAAELGVAERIHFLGQVAHDLLPHLLSAADAMVLPSEREGLANVWIEALACGTPVIIPDIGGAREVVTGPAAGRIVARDGQAIADAAAEILAAPPTQEQVARHAERFSWEANARQLVGFWQQVAGKRT